MTYWATQYQTNHWVHPDKELEQQAIVAIQSVGTNAAPAFLNMLTTKESPWRVKFLASVPKTWLTKVHLSGVEDYRKQLDERRVLGAQGFAALGDKAKPILPGLVSLTTNTNQRVRYLSFFTLRCLGPAAKDQLPLLIAHLNDPDFGIRDESVMSLGTIQADPEKVIPILTNFIQKNRSDWILCSDGIRSLWGFSNQARSAVPLLRDLLHSDNAEIRSTASNALVLIGPAN